MFRITLLFSLMCIYISACKKAEQPIIPKEKMIEILADIHISEAALANTSPGTKDSIAGVYLTQILKIHHVARKDFDQSLKIYNHDPLTLEPMYDEVLKDLDEKASK